MQKANPENIYLARRAAGFRRLVDERHVDELDAEHWIAAWEREAEIRGLDRHNEEDHDIGQAPERRSNFGRRRVTWVQSSRVTAPPVARRRGRREPTMPLPS